MKKVCFLTVAVTFAIGGAVRAQDESSIPTGSLLSGLGQFFGDGGVPWTPGNSPFTNGLGQTVSGWTHQGIHGQELADRIHWLQDARDGDRDRFRDIREDRRELRNDERRLREDERRLRRDREDFRRDLRDRDDPFRGRDLREDRRELRNDERRLREDERRVDRDRQDLRRDLRDRDRDRDDRFRDRDRDRDRDDHFRDRDRQRDDRFRDRDEHEHATRDHDPRRDRDDRRRDRDNSARKNQDVHGSHDRGHDHSLAHKDDFGKHNGALAGKTDNHHAVNDLKRVDTHQHMASFKNDHHASVPSHHASVPSPKNTKNPVGKGKGK